MLTVIDSKWTQGTYINFREDGYYRVGGTTKVFTVINRKDGRDLGQVRWYVPWRKYSFFPYTDTVYEDVCLTEIAEFALSKTVEHRSKT